MMEKLENVIKGLECCVMHVDCAADGGCPYISQVDHKCLETVIKDALALLKAQGPRVMTLEEVLEVPYPTPIYHELRGSKYVYMALVSTRETLRRRGMVELRTTYEETPGVLNHEVYDEETYNKVWRCWTHKPSAEQMKGAAWDD